MYVACNNQYVISKDTITQMLQDLLDWPLSHVSKWEAHLYSQWKEYGAGKLHNKSLYVVVLISNTVKWEIRLKKLTKTYSMAPQDQISAICIKGHMLHIWADRDSCRLLSNFGVEDFQHSYVKGDNLLIITCHNHIILNENHRITFCVMHQVRDIASKSAGLSGPQTKQDWKY